MQRDARRGARPAGRAALAAVLALATVALAAGVWTGRAGASPGVDAEEARFLTLINEYRAQHGLGPLEIDPSLQAAAEWMSQDMGEKAYFSHADSQGRDPWTRMCAFGYCYNTYKGENIAAGYRTAEEALAGWIASAPHNENMLNPNFRATGIARVETPGSPHTVYWTNDFGGVTAADVRPPQGTEPTPAPAPAATQPAALVAPAPAVPEPAPPAAPAPTPEPVRVVLAPLPPKCLLDRDCDSFGDDAERYIRTDGAARCSKTAKANDEWSDAWPPDVNDDRRVDGADVRPYRLRLHAEAGEAAFTPRLDLNGDREIDLLDVVAVARHFGASC